MISCERVHSSRSSNLGNQRVTAGSRLVKLLALQHAESDPQLTLVFEALHELIEVENGSTRM